MLPTLMALFPCIKPSSRCPPTPTASLFYQTERDRWHQRSCTASGAAHDKRTLNVFSTTSTQIPLLYYGICWSFMVAVHVSKVSVLLEEAQQPHHSRADRRLALQQRHRPRITHPPRWRVSESLTIRNGQDQHHRYCDTLEIRPYNILKLKLFLKFKWA